MSDVRPGTFLVASPTLHDPNFARTVVLICEHSAQGSMGIVTNRPSEMRLPEALAGVCPPPLPDTPLYLGGPVQRQALLVLHRMPAPVPGSQEVAHGISIGGDMERLLAALTQMLSAGERPDAGAAGEPGQIRFYAGYAGWGAGQLAAELEMGSWIVCPGTAAEVFALDVEHLWETVLRRLGPDFARLITVPLDPRVN
jgi:putative transcriptional regulator